MLKKFSKKEIQELRSLRSPQAKERISKQDEDLIASTIKETSEKTNKIQEETSSLVSDVSLNIIDLISYVEKGFEKLEKKEPVKVENKEVIIPPLKEVDVNLKDNTVYVENIKDIVIPELKFPQVQKVALQDEEPSDITIDRNTDGLVKQVIYTYSTQRVTQTFVRDSDGNIIRVKTKINAI